jgi:hypothetical protein
VHLLLLLESYDYQKGIESLTGYIKSGTNFLPLLDGNFSIRVASTDFKISSPVRCFSPTLTLARKEEILLFVN